MKVIHFLHELKFSGAEIMYVDAASIFKSLGCELTVVNTHKSLGEYANTFIEAGYIIEHKYIPYTFWGKWKMRKELIKFLKEGKYDVVHIHRNDLRWILSYCAFKAGIKAIYTTHNVFHSHWYSYPLHFLYRWSAQNIFRCTFQAISDSVEKHERDYYHTSTHLIHNWYNNNRFFPATNGEKEKIRKELNIKSNSLVIISVGGCSPIKRHCHVIYALKEIIKTYPDAIYLHLGEGVSLEEEQQLAKDFYLDKNIRFCGNQKDVRKYLIASDIYVMTSVFEGISLTTIEAMACCIPTILYNVPGLRDFNKQKKCSIIISEDYHKLAGVIIDLYNNSKTQEQLIKNGKELVEYKYNMATNAKKIFDLYKS